MRSPRFAAILPLLPILAIGLLALGFAAACGDGDGGGATPTEEATATVEEPSPTAEETPAPGPNEAGEAPVFYRTGDDFASLRAGEPYTVVFRITNGYAEPTLSVIAECLDCPGPAQQEPLEIEGAFSEPVGEDAPGSYYPMNLELPFEGSWKLTVLAGDDEVVIQVEAQPGQPASG